MKEQNIYDRLRGRTKPETKQYVQKNLSIIAEIDRLLKEKGWTQKELAKKMGKSESELSRWFSGLHNLTLKSIAKLEVVLDAEILTVPKPKPENLSVKCLTMSIRSSNSTSHFGKSNTKTQFHFDESQANSKSMIA